ncbi:MAG: ABC transporter ATP-binding protein [Bacteroidota bacterium]
MIQNILFFFRATRTSLARMAFWEFLHGFLIAAPSGILLLIIWELFAQPRDPQRIWSLIAVMATLFVLQLLVSRKAIVHTNNAIFSMCAKIRIMLGNKLHRVSLGYYKKNDPGDLAAIVLQDVGNFESIFSHTIESIFGALFGTLVLSSFLLYLDWQLALLMLLAIPVGFGFVFVAGLFSQRSNEAYIRSRNAASSRFIEYILGIVHLKAFNLTGDRHAKLIRTFDRLRRDSIRMELIPGPFVLTAFVVLELFFLGMVYVALARFQEQTLSIPVLIAFLIVGYRLYEPLKILMINYTMLKYMNVSVRRIRQLLDAPLQSHRDVPLPMTYDIQFEDVSFAYDDRRVLDRVSFKMPHGGMTALVGASGSGKTTIVNLIARFWDIQEGRIKIGGVDLADLPPESIYELISEVFQDVYLFDDTILNNIMIGNPQASEAAIARVIEKAQVSEFLEDLPEGLHTKVGEGGAHLSGGQKQRISIARAMLKDAPIILLDEATASLDPENEIYIQRAIQELVKDKNVIVIAHKLQTVRHADKILVLEDGRIREQGRHEDLLAQDGLYARFWRTQQRNTGWKITRQAEGATPAAPPSQ